MNPFDLRGPEFLLFYWALAALCLLVVLRQRALAQVGGEPSQLISDPYPLAYLREGYSEVIRVALLSLVQERAVIVEGRTFLAAGADKSRIERPRPPLHARRAVERALLGALKRPLTIDQIVNGEIGKDACTGYWLELEGLGYVVAEARVASAREVRRMAIFLLAGVAFIKLLVALVRGRNNVGFLVLSACTALFLTLQVKVPSGPTRRGEAALDAAQALLGDARKRLLSLNVRPPTPELALVAAMFGFSLFNATERNFAFWPALAFETPRAPPAGMWGSAPGHGWSSSIGSSCSTGSSCGGGGSSCGGGGGGGGCGGCGGGH